MVGVDPSAHWQAGSSRSRPQRRWWISLAGVGIVLIGGAYWAGTESASPAAIESSVAPAARVSVTAAVVLRKLSQTLVAQGTLKPRTVLSVNFGPVSVPGAQPIVTAEPIRARAVVTNGSLVAQVAGRPIFTMIGSTPMYRDLTVGDHGPDVAQLQSDLADLGFPDYDAFGVFGHSTELAVQYFYDHAGFPVPTVAGGSPKHPQVMVPEAEIVFTSELPAVVQHSSLILGQPISNPALTLSTGRLRALISLSAAQVSLVHVGDVATLFLSGTTSAGMRIPAKVAALKIGSSGATAVLRPGKPLSNSMAEAKVGARIVIASTRKAVLAVPVAALYTGADGQPVVTVIARKGRRISIPVVVSPEIGGFVPVRPLRGRLAAGARVLVGE